MITLSERIERDGITAEASFGLKTDENFPESDHWEVTLTWGKRQIKVDFYTGYGLRERLTNGPEAADVLDCMISDAVGFENAQSFEEWADEYEYDTDSRKAEKTYETVRRETEKLRAFLGEAYEAYLWETERD